MVDLDERLRHSEGPEGLIKKDDASNLAGYAIRVADLMGIYFISG